MLTKVVGAASSLNFILFSYAIDRRASERIRISFILLLKIMRISFAIRMCRGVLLLLFFFYSHDAVCRTFSLFLRTYTTSKAVTLFFSKPFESRIALLRYDVNLKIITGIRVSSRRRGLPDAK